MDKDFLNTLSDLELVKLQHEARRAGDKETVDSILRLLREREKQKPAIEHLRYISFLETEIDYGIIMQFDGGGAMLKIGRKDDSRAVIAKLRYFAELLDRSIAERNPPIDPAPKV